VKRFADGFIRMNQTDWFCRAAVEFIAADGTRHAATPGVTYRRGGHILGGLDIAAALEHWTTHQQPPPGITFPEEQRGPP
jgi:hypothetical protein